MTLLSSRVARRIAIVAAIIVAGALIGFWLEGPVGLAVERDRAEQLYRDRSWHAADTAFSAVVREATAHRLSGMLPSLEYNSGNVSYRLGRFQEAERRYQGGLGGSRELRERTYFNLGNSYVWQARAEYDRVGKRSALRAAIDSYEEALLLDPQDRDAKWNLEIALLRLEDAQDSAGAGLRRGDANWGGGNLTKSGYEGAPQTGAGATPGGGYGTSSGEDAVKQITETEAREMLKTVEQAQVTGQQAGAQPTPSAQRPSHERDW
jgi:tetratricopeptide (TPR) repeat protein